MAHHRTPALRGTIGLSNGDHIPLADEYLPQNLRGQNVPLSPNSANDDIEGIFREEHLCHLLPDGRSRTDLGTDPAPCADGFINAGLFIRGVPHQTRTFEDTCAEAVATAAFPEAALLIDFNLIKAFLFLGTDQRALSFQNQYLHPFLILKESQYCFHCGRHIKGINNLHASPETFTDSSEVDDRSCLSCSGRTCSWVGLKTGHGCRTVVQKKKQEVRCIIMGIHQGRHGSMIES